MTLSVPSAVGNQNTFLLVFFSNESGNSSPTATYNGVSLTRASLNGGVSGSYWSTYFYLPNPATGTNNLVLNWSGNDTSVGVGAVILKNVASIDIDGNNGTSNGMTMSESLTTSVNNDLVVVWAVVYEYLRSGIGGFTVGGSQTSIVNYTPLGATVGYYYGELSSAPQNTAGAISVSESWTGANTQADIWAVALKYQAPISSSNASPAFLKRLM